MMLNRLIAVSLLLLILAGIYGDPHLMTSDGNLYSFSGLGEFTLVRADAGNNLNVQVGKFFIAFFRKDIFVSVFVCVLLLSEID